MDIQEELAMKKTVKKSRFSQKTEKRILIFTFTIIANFCCFRFDKFDIGHSFLKIISFFYQKNLVFSLQNTKEVV